MATVLTEEVASGFEEAAELTRRVDTRAVSFFVGGIGFGVVLGFFFGYRFHREKVKAEAFAESAKEVDKIRKVYEQTHGVQPDEKTHGVQPKPSIDDVIEERGYTLTADELGERPLKPPVVITPTPVPDSVRTTRGSYSRPKSSTRGWDYDAELAARAELPPNQPYIIHEDERNELDGYDNTDYSYWVVDGVLTDSDETPIRNLDETIGGIENLQFGHGSGDMDIVFIRNPRLRLEIEVTQLHQSYEEVVKGSERAAAAREAAERVNTKLEHSRTPNNPRQKKRRH